MAKPKRHDSETYLRTRYVRQGKSIADIAKECNVTERTIRDRLKKFGIRR